MLYKKIKNYVISNLERKFVKGAGEKTYTTYKAQTHVV